MKESYEYKIFKLKSPRTLSNTLPSISHKTSMKTNHAVIKTVYSGSNKCWDTVTQTWLVLMLSRGRIQNSKSVHIKHVR